MILRPCELRALIELQKRNRGHYPRTASDNDGESLVIMSVDCPGTFSLVEYAQYVAAHQDDAEMTRIEMADGGRDSHIPYQIRTAYQMCDLPGPVSADITIGTIGITPQSSLLVIARDADIDAKLKLREVTDGMGTEGQVARREVKKLLIDACRFDSLKLAEIESRAKFRGEIHFQDK